MPAEDPAAGTHGQVSLLLHEGLQGEAADHELDSVDTRAVKEEKVQPM